MKLLETTDYKQYVNTIIASMPKRGRGQYQKMAESLRVHATLVSQVFKGERELTLEQASQLTLFMGMNHVEAEYFITLVELKRAGNLRLKEILELRLQRLKSQLT